MKTSSILNEIDIADYFDGGRFHNLSGNSPKNLWAVLMWLATRSRRPWPKHLPVLDLPPAPKPKTGELAVTFINHSTFLLQTENLALLTDPIYSERASPVAFAGPKRVRKPGVNWSALPQIDLVLVSHNHYDHMDVPTLRRLEQEHKPAFVTSLGNRAPLLKAGLRRIIELEWWQTISPRPSFSITLTPAEHFSGRGLFDRNRTLWGGFFAHIDGIRIFYAGDSAYGSHFKAIAERLGKADVALLPIGAYQPRWFMKDVHMEPEEAVRAHLDLRSGISVGMHFGTFKLSDEAIDDPIRALEASLRKHTVDARGFRLLGFGESQIIHRSHRQI